MEKFAGYGFNKSHSAAYALLSYQTGLAEGALSGGVHGGGAVSRHGHTTEKVVTFIDECREHGSHRAAAGRQ